MSSVPAHSPSSFLPSSGPTPCSFFLWSCLCDPFTVLHVAILLLICSELRGRGSQCDVWVYVHMHLEALNVFPYSGMPQLPPTGMPLSLQECLQGKKNMIKSSWYEKVKAL